MTVRLTRSALLLTLIVLLAATAGGCSRHRQAAPASSSTPEVSLTWPTRRGVVRPTPVRSDLARRDPAVWVAVEFQLQQCNWDWRTPRAIYVGAQQAFATHDYGQQIAASSDPASWQREVVTERQVVTCTVSDPVRVPDAPSTAQRVYVRMSTDSHITSTLGSFESGARTASWIVQLVTGHWRVTGPFDGG